MCSHSDSVVAHPLTSRDFQSHTHVCYCRVRLHLCEFATALTDCLQRRQDRSVHGKQHTSHTRPWSNVPRHRSMAGRCRRIDRLQTRSEFRFSLPRSQHEKSVSLFRILLFLLIKLFSQPLVVDRESRPFKTIFRQTTTRAIKKDRRTSPTSPRNPVAR